MLTLERPRLVSLPAPVAPCVPAALRHTLRRLSAELREELQIPLAGHTVASLWVPLSTARECSARLRLGLPDPVPGGYRWIVHKDRSAWLEDVPRMDLTLYLQTARIEEGEA